MATEAADLERAITDVERIAKALWEASIADWRETVVTDPRAWEAAHVEEREHMRRVVRSLLSRGVIKVGTRPGVERPMEGQVTIDDALGGESSCGALS